MPLSLALLSLASLVVAITAIVHAVLLVGHRRDDLTPGQLWLPGHLFYRPSAFKPSGRAMQRRFVVLVGAFVVLWVVRFGVGVALGVGA